MTYEIRFPPEATRGLRQASGDQRRLRWRIRMLAARAAIHAPSLRARSAAGRLAEPGPLADADTPTLAAALGIRRYRFVQTVFSSR
jgi:hypothetical protein